MYIGTEVIKHAADGTINEYNKYISGKVSTACFGSKLERDKWPKIDFNNLEYLYFSMNVKHRDPNKTISKFKFLMTFTHKVTFVEMKKLHHDQRQVDLLRVLGLSHRKEEMTKMSSHEMREVLEEADEMAVKRLNKFYIDYYKEERKKNGRAQNHLVEIEEE